MSFAVCIRTMYEPVASDRTSSSILPSKSAIVPSQVNTSRPRRSSTLTCTCPASESLNCSEIKERAGFGHNVSMATPLVYGGSDSFETVYG